MQNIFSDSELFDGKNFLLRCCVFCCFFATNATKQQKNLKNDSTLNPKILVKNRKFFKNFFLRFLSLNNVSTQMLYDPIPCGTCLATKNRNLLFFDFRLKSLRKKPGFLRFFEKLLKLNFK